MSTSKAGPLLFINVWNILIYVTEATVPFKMQTLGDFSNAGQPAFNVRTLSVFVAV